LAQNLGQPCEFLAMAADRWVSARMRCTRGVAGVERQGHHASSSPSRIRPSAFRSTAAIVCPCCSASQSTKTLQVSVIRSIPGSSAWKFKVCDRVSSFVTSVQGGFRWQQWAASAALLGDPFWNNEPKRSRPARPHRRRPAGARWPRSCVGCSRLQARGKTFSSRRPRSPLPPSSTLLYLPPPPPHAPHR
jgi:hypothetical protein